VIVLSLKTEIPPVIFSCLDAEGEKYDVDIELPGVEKKDINLHMNEDILHIIAEREDLTFHSHLHFPIKVNPKKTKAKFTSGLLAVEAPLKEKRAPPIKIKIK
jgi:HSP20 family molecular chaperone IbpA